MHIRLYCPCRTMKIQLFERELARLATVHVAGWEEKEAEEVEETVFKECGKTLQGGQYRKS